MKKILSAFVIAMFLISIVPIAFAEEDEGSPGINTDSAWVDSTEQKNRFEERRNTFQDEAKQKIEELKEKRANVRAELTKEGEELHLARLQAKAKFAKSKAELNKVVEIAKERRAKAIELQKEAKDKIQARKVEVKKCKGDESDSCKQLRKETKKDVKAFLENTADRVLALLEKLEEKVQESDLDDAAKAKLLEDLKIQMEEIASAKESFSELSEESAQQEIQQAAKSVRDAWKEAQKSIKNSAHAVAAQKMGGILVKIEQLNTKLKRIRDRLEAKGQSVSAIDNFIADFQAKLEKAKEYHKEAVALRLSGDVSGATAKIRAAHQEIKGAQTALREVLKGIKNAKGGAEELEQAASEEVPSTEETPAEEPAVEETPVEEPEEEETPAADESETEETPAAEEPETE